MNRKSPYYTVARHAIALAFATLSASAMAGRYWLGTTTAALFSESDNWASSGENGTKGKGKPDGNNTGTTYFYRYKNGLTVFDEPGSVAGNVCVSPENPIDGDVPRFFVWRATSSANGFTSTGEFQLANTYSPAYLQIDSGAYTFGTTRIGYVDNATAYLRVNGGTFSGNTIRVGGGKTGVNGTLEISGGTVSTRSTEEDAFTICNVANTTGMLVINEGGTLDTTSGNVSIGYVADIDAQVQMNGGVWKIKRIYAGGKGNKTAYNVANSKTKITLNGGVMTIADESGLGYAYGEGSFAEMVVNEGATVNGNFGYFYIGVCGPASLTIDGGTFTMANSDNGGLSFGRTKNSGNDVGTLVVKNGGTVTTKRLRLDYVQPGSKAVFDGGVLKATAATSSFINDSPNLTCEIGPGGLTVDTAGFDITIAHAFVKAEDAEEIGTITKIGAGKLTLSAEFPADKIIVKKGTVTANGTTYEPTVPVSSEKRYWLGATSAALASDSANWAAEKGGEAGATAPGEDYYGGLYFDGPFANSKTVFDSALKIASNVFVDTNGETPLVWSATDAACGMSFADTDWIIGSNTVENTKTKLQIDSGTYDSKYFRLGYMAGGKAEYVQNGGTVTVKQGRVAGGGDGNEASLTLNGGTFKATEDFFILSGAKSGCKATVTVDGGTLDTTAPGFVKIGESGTDGTALLHMKSGTWNTKSFLVGGTNKKTANNMPGTVATLLVDGGTINATADCSVGANAGDGGRSEMIISNGTVNISANVLYVGDGAPGYLTVCGGELNIKDTDYGLGLGHAKNDGTGGDPAFVTFEGGTSTMPKFRLDYVASGSVVVFDGGTIKATRDQPNFIGATEYLVCEIREGGLVFDTNGHDVTIAHDLTGVGGVVKKGAGTLTLAGNNTFEGEITIEEGDVVADGIIEEVTEDPATYTTQLALEADGQDFGTVQLHRSPLSFWLANANFDTYTSVYGARGTDSKETPRYIEISGGGETVTFMNLNTDATYEGTVGGMAYTFKTEDVAPRTLRIDFPSGYAANVRDVGSWPLETLDGKKMNQDVILRGGHLDGFVDASAEQKTASYLTRIGLKSEIDLRISTLDDMRTKYKELENGGESYAADGCAYYRFGLGWGEGEGTQIAADAGGNFTNQIHNVFSTFGAEGALPAYFHCRIGTDRTGITGLLLLGLMGVEEEVLYRDYLMSNFANIGGSRNADIPEDFLRYILRGNCNSMKYLYDTKDAQYGKSVASRCRQYLEMCGVSAEEIGRITKALSGETPEEVLARVDAYESANGFRTVSYVPYPGSSTTNAIHRFGRDSRRILPRDTPQRSGYVFGGWDVDNETDTGDGTAVVYAKWTVDNGPKTRYWADTNGEREKFSRPASWDPAPDSMAKAAEDTFVMNKGVEKIAVCEAGDAVSVCNLYIGEGAGNLGGRLDITGGTLTVTNYFRMGVDGSAAADSVVNITEGRLLASNVRTGHGDSAAGSVHDEIDITGNGAFEATAGDVRFSDGASGSTVVNITDGGTFKTSGEVYIGYSGRATVNVEDAVFDMSGKHLHVGRAAGSNGELTLDSVNDTVNIDQLRIADDAGSRGKMTVKGENTTVNSSFAIYVGKKGDGEFTIDGGLVSSAYALQFGDDDASGNTAVFNLNGGVLKTAQVNLHGGTKGIWNWNGGTLQRGNNTWVSNGEMCPANGNLEIRVLEGGAIYDGGDSFSQPLTGSGAFIKRGGGTATIKGAFNCRGGIKVEGGGLVFTDDSLVKIAVREVSVAAGCTMDLEGAEVTTKSFTVNGEPMPAGTYGRFGGTIIVLSAEQTEPATAEWLNTMGDGDLTNPDNWLVKAADGTAIFDALPDSNTIVYVYPGTARPDFSGLDVKAVYLTVGENTYLRGEGCTPPDIVKNANGWYDFDDASTLTVSGDTSSEMSVSAVRNKGKDGEALDALAYGDDDAVLPLYGANKVNGRDVLSLTRSDEDSVKRKGFRTAELGLTNNQDRAIIAVSRRGNAYPHYPLGIEHEDNTEFNPEKTLGHFRIMSFAYFQQFLFCNAKSSTIDDTTGETVYEYESKVMDAGQRLNDWSISLFQSANMEVTAMMYSQAHGLTSNTMIATDMNTLPDERLYIGHARFNHSDANRGQIAEALYYDHALTEEEVSAVYSYLQAKWFTPVDLDNIPSSILLKNNATLDFGGGSWTFDKIKGAGTIGTADVTVTGSIDAGVTVEGDVTFSDGAGIDISSLDNAAAGTTVELLTANSATGYPPRVVSGKRMVDVKTRTNADGTVTLYGTLVTKGFNIRLR